MVIQELYGVKIELTKEKKEDKIIKNIKSEVIIMDAKKVFNQILLERNMTYEDVAIKLDINTQSLRNKINRGNYGLTDFIKMMDILDCDLQVVTRDSKKIFD